jgi:Histone deacetylase domain
VRVEARPASREELERVHPAGYLDALKRISDAGGGNIDSDTGASVDSWDAAVLAAGAGLNAVERLQRAEATAAFCAVRPPGHHATPKRPIGFCLLNNAAVTALPWRTRASGCSSSTGTPCRGSAGACVAALAAPTTNRSCRPRAGRAVTSWRRPGTAADPAERCALAAEVQSSELPPLQTPGWGRPQVGGRRRPHHRRGRPIDTATLAGNKQVILIERSQVGVRNAQ